MRQNPVIVCDPALIVSASASDPTAFWTRFSEWTADRRLLIGLRARREVIDRRSQEIWDPTSTAIPKHLRREVTSQINRFLPRAALTLFRSSLGTYLFAHYTWRATVSVGATITSDLISVLPSPAPSCLYSGTTSEFWDQSSPFLEYLQFKYVYPPCFRTESAAPRLTFYLQIREFYRSSTILIVGGKKDPKVIATWHQFAGIGERETLSGLSLS